VDDQEHTFQAAYGEAMFYAHLIEDLLELHLYECSYFHVNQYPGLSRKKIRKMNHANRIDELSKIYGEQNEEEGSIPRLVAALHHLRIIRNHLTHAFIPEIGSDFTAEEGVDQIIAMIKNVVYWERGWLATLQDAHEAVLKAGLTHDICSVMMREDPPFNARVSKSKIQGRLDALQEQLRG
jgi:hypothetical protein